MDKIINKHVDTIEELERQLDIIIEQEVSQISIEAIIISPAQELTRVAENIKRIFLDEYADEALELGFDFGRLLKDKIEKDKTIKIDNSNNPNLNDTGEDSK